MKLNKIVLIELESKSKDISGTERVKVDGSEPVNYWAEGDPFAAEYNQVLVARIKL